MRPNNLNFFDEIIIRENSRRNEEEALTFQDVLVCSSYNPKLPSKFCAGEFGFDDKNETPNDTIGRIYQLILSLIYQIKNLHTNKKNHITRLITNEFFFYTQRPLTMFAFQRLLQTLLGLAKHLPKNIHLILGSFAVLTHDDRVMNVTPFIEIGNTLRLNLILKTSHSSIDPNYIKEKNQQTTFYRNATIKNFNPNETIFNIDGKTCPVSFNNLFECETVGGKKFFCCIDVCLDHQKEIAKMNFETKIHNHIRDLLQGKIGPITKNIPKYISYIVISNTIEIAPSNSFGQIVAHSDPRHTPLKFKYKQKHAHNDPCFGKEHHIYYDLPYDCAKLAKPETDLVDLYVELHDCLRIIKLENINMRRFFQNYFQSEYHALHWSIKHGHEPLSYALTKEMAKTNVDLQNVIEKLKHVQKRIDDCANNVFVGKRSKIIKTITTNMSEKIIKLKRSTISYFDYAYQAWNYYYFRQRLKKQRKINLLEAVIENDIQMINQLIAHKKEVNAQDDLGNTPLHWAIYFNNENLCQQLLSFHPDLCIRNKNNENIMQVTKYSRNKKIIREVEDFLNKKLSTAILFDNTDQVFCLLKAGANPNYIINRQKMRTLLIHAELTGASNEIITYLLKYNVEPDKSLLSCVLNHHKNLNILVTELVHFGADINTRFPENDTPLHLLIKNNANPNVVKHFLKNGAKMNYVNDDGISPYELAQQKGMHDHVKLFKSHAERRKQKKKNKNVVLPNFINKFNK